MSDIDFNPDWISPPGDTIIDILRERSISRHEFAQHIEVTTEQAAEILLGVARITEETARRLHKIVGGTIAFWLKRESQYSEELTRRGSRIAKGEAQRWLQELPLNYMVKAGWVEHASAPEERLANCLRFFGVSNLSAWKQYYCDAVEVAYRTSPSFQSHKGAVSTWLRLGEIQATSLDCAPWNREQFLKTLPTIRKLTRCDEPREFIPELKRLCAKCGVALAIVRAPNGCRASGATRFLSSERALMILSFRHLSDDHFWFTFFHEAGHLILHGEGDVFLDENDQITSVKESEANDFANEVLIPSTFHAAFEDLQPETRAIVRFARTLGVSRGIIVGQLQHAGRVPRHHFNALKQFFKWEEIGS